MKFCLEHKCDNSPPETMPRRNRRGNVTNSYSEWKDRHHPISRYHTCGDFTVHHNIRLHDSIVHYISSDQLASTISLSHSWSHSSPPDHLASTTIYGI